MMQQVLGTLLLLSISGAEGYNYITGIALRSYEMGEEVGPIKVNSLFSHEDLVSLDFYSLKFCSPSKSEITEKSKDEKLGEVIWGDRIAPSLYKAEMMKDVKCKKVQCQDNKINEVELQRFERRINAGYRGTFVLDNLPVISNASWVYEAKCPSGKQIYDTHTRGFSLGVPKSCLETETHIHNHLALHIHANEQPNGKYVIVGFYVVPYSVDYSGATECNDNMKLTDTHPVTTNPKQTNEITWTYSVEWHKSDVEWGNRWDAYLNLAFSNRNARVHWLGIVNSSLIILCLATIVAMIIIRALRMDILKYEEEFEQQEIIDEVGWKLVHGDVFRTPGWPRMYAILLGTGVQLLGMSFLVFVFALLGFLSPANRGGLLTAAILLFVLMSLVNGYVTAMVLKMFYIEEWKTIFGAALFFPGWLFAFWVFSEILIISTRPSYNSAPVIYNTLYMFALWLGVSLPLVILGASFGRKGPIPGVPVKVNPVARAIPPQRWYLDTWFLLVVPGLVPFGAAFIELRFILSSMWQGMVYYVFGFLSLTALTVLVVSIEVTVVVVYFLLVFEDHRWWWKAFVIPGGMGIHFFLYSLYYAQTQLRIHNPLSQLIFVEIMLTFSTAIYIAIGTVGIVSGYLFVRIIYGSIKVE
eukprot:TRINITY_DN30582_c0_g1_i1.p1 TRINITY_DN30582_c0_g1~~TRINITY_DN30582_c0_g1_i1.p1  ORF type:complete len:640 (+),score=167.78 TRINITY_DN30582_c0_g1_i1:51-1970(+)